MNFSFISIPVLESFVRTHDQLSLTTHLHLENLLERGIRVLFHNGVCHWLGVFRRPLAPDRSGSSDFSVAQKRDRVVDASVAEWLKNSLLLTFVIVEGAGYHVCTSLSTWRSSRLTVFAPFYPEIGGGK